MGLGFFTSEEVLADGDTGKLLSDGTWEYKIPAATCIPREFNATFLKVRPNVPCGALVTHRVRELNWYSVCSGFQTMF